MKTKIEYFVYRNIDTKNVCLYEYMCVKHYLIERKQLLASNLGKNESICNNPKGIKMTCAKFLFQSSLKRVS